VRESVASPAVRIHRQAAPRAWTQFPFDLLLEATLPGEQGSFIELTRDLSMIPPFPWGQWTYGSFLAETNATLHGNVLEAGVGRGGMSLYLALVIRSLGGGRKVFAVDSYMGLPKPDPARDNSYFSEGEYGPAAPDADLALRLWLESARLDLSDLVVPVQGSFNESLPQVAPEGPFSLVHIDADLYTSVRCALEHLYDHVEDGGAIAIDDFFHPAQGPSRAAAEFFNDVGIIPLYHVVFPYSVIVVKGEHRTFPRPARSIDGNAYSFDRLRNDRVFIEAVKRSAMRSRRDRRARGNAAALVDLLERQPSASDIYDYWRALEPFWAWMDVLPSERDPHRL
jgi:hypothetical protein